MNKVITALFGILLFVSALFTGTSAFADVATSCAQLGHSAKATDADYNPALDKDRDGVICENQSTVIPPNGGVATIPNNAPPAQTSIRDANGNVISPATGQVDANGKPIQLDSHGNPIKTDANGNPVKQGDLASTGTDGALIWTGVGLVALAVGLITLYFARRRRTA